MQTNNELMEKPEACPVSCRDYEFTGQCKHTYPTDKAA